MESFYDSQDIDPETFEDLEIGDDGKVIFEFSLEITRRYMMRNYKLIDYYLFFRLATILKICFIQIEKNSIQ